MNTKLFLAGALLIAGAANAQNVTNQKVGNGIYELVYNEADNSVYVASAGSRTKPGGFLYQLDGSTLLVKDSIALTDTPPFGLGLNKKTQTVYSTNTRTNSVSAVDIKNKKVLATIKPDAERSHTREAVADEKNNKIYISDVGRPSKIWVIDGKTQKLEKMIENTGASTTGMVIDESAQKLYATNMGTNKIIVVDLKSAAVVDSFATGGEGSINLAFDKSNNRLFVVSQKSNDVNVIDLKTKSVTKTLPAGKGALGIAFDEKRNRLYTANRGDGTVTVIDTKALSVLDNIKTGGTFPNTVVVNKKDGSIYVTNKGQGKRDEPSYVDPNGDVVTHIKF